MSYDNGESKVYPTKLGPLDKLAIKELYGSSKTDGKHVAAWSWNKRTETLTQIGKEHADKIHGTGVKDAIQGRGGNDRLFGFDGDDTLNGGAGNDTLYGSFGDDVFIFDTPLDPVANVDADSDARVVRHRCRAVPNLRHRSGSDAASQPGAWLTQLGDRLARLWTPGRTVRG